MNVLIKLKNGEKIIYGNCVAVTQVTKSEKHYIIFDYEKMISTSGKCLKAIYPKITSEKLYLKDIEKIIIN